MDRVKSVRRGKGAGDAGDAERKEQGAMAAPAGAQ